MQTPERKAPRLTQGSKARPSCCEATVLTATPATVLTATPLCCPLLKASLSKRPLERDFLDFSLKHCECMTTNLEAFTSTINAFDGFGCGKDGSGSECHFEPHHLPCSMLVTSHKWVGDGAKAPNEQLVKAAKP